MLGAIAGDIIGSPSEGTGAKISAFHGRLPPEITRFCREVLPQPLLDIVDRFRETYRIDT